MNENHENRFYTKSGGKKRIGAEFEKFAVFAMKNKQSLREGSLISLIKEIRDKWQWLKLAEAMDFAVYLNGVFDNNSHIYSQERHDRGKLIAAEILRRGQI